MSTVAVEEEEEEERRRRRGGGGDPRPVFRQNFRQELPSECEVTGGVTLKIISWILLIIILRWFYCLCESFAGNFHTLKIISKIILQSGNCFEMIVEPPQSNFIVNMLEIILR